MNMNSTHSLHRIIAVAMGLVMLALSSFASADPPTRVARLSYASGAVSFSPAGEENWVQARINRPLVSGDRLWADADGRVEVQAGHALIRMGQNTSVTLLNMDDNVTQLHLARGSLSFRVRRLEPGEVFEVDTPNLSFTVRLPGAYRTDVDIAGNATTVRVFNGQGEVAGNGTGYTIYQRRGYRFAGSGLRDYQNFALSPPDDFDRWADARDRRNEASVSARYVSPEIVGYEDVDDNGTWRFEPDYGNVWVPVHQQVDWSPFRNGHWAWLDPWGWTWVDDAPWGFAVSHYGRWVFARNTWCWVPGPMAVRPVYAPAVVAFVGGPNFSLSLSFGSGGGVAWFPLGPHDVYRPPYPVSRGYFTNINTSNSTITNTTINNVYNTKNITNITSINLAAPGAVTAIPTTAFTHAMPVAVAAVPVSAALAAKAKITPDVAVATAASVIGSVSRASSTPPPTALAQPKVGKTPLPPSPVPFASKQPLLVANPGTPIGPKSAPVAIPATPSPAPAAVAPTTTLAAMQQPRHIDASPIVTVPNAKPATAVNVPRQGEITMTTPANASKPPGVNLAPPSSSVPPPPQARWSVPPASTPPPHEVRLTPERGPAAQTPKLAAVQPPSDSLHPAQQPPKQGEPSHRQAVPQHAAPPSHNAGKQDQRREE